MRDKAQVPLIVKPASPDQLKHVVRTISEAEPSWLMGLSFKAYYDRWLYFLEHAGYQCTPWILVPRDEPDTLHFLAYSHTWRWSVAYVPPRSMTVSIRSAIGCGAMYVPQDRRGAHFSHVMLSKLGDICKQSESLQSVMPDLNDLFAAGTNSTQDGFYMQFARKGRSDEIAWSAKPLVELLQPYKLELLREEDLDALARRDCQQIKRELPRSDSLDSHRFAVLPTPDVWRFVTWTSKFNARHVGKRAEPDIFGVRIVDRTEFAFMIWSRPINEDVLLILRLRACARQQLVALLRCAQQYAQKHGISKIRAWNVDKDLLDSRTEKSTRRHDLTFDIQWWEGGEEGKLAWWACEPFCAVSAGYIFG